MSTRAIKSSSEPLVSVVIPTYNRVSTLGRAVNSVLAQTFQNFELIIVDDASTDATGVYFEALLAGANVHRGPVLNGGNTTVTEPATAAITAGLGAGAKARSTLESGGGCKIDFDRYEGRWPIRVLKNKKNLGVSSARNLGIENSRGEWLAFLDSDDEWLPEKLASQINFVQGQKKISRLVHSDEIWIRNGVRVNQMNKHQKSGGRIFKRCVDLCCISPSSVLLNRSLLADVGLFREDFVVCEDYELWLRVSAFEEVGFVDKPLIKKYGGHGDQLSRSTVGMDLWRLRALLPFVKENFIRMDYRDQRRGLPENFRGTADGSTNVRGTADGSTNVRGTADGSTNVRGTTDGSTNVRLSSDSHKPAHVRDLLGGSFNEEFGLITEDERKYAMAAVLLRLEILRKGAEKHGNDGLLAELNEIRALID